MFNRRMEHICDAPCVHLHYVMLTHQCLQVAATHAASFAREVTPIEAANTIAALASMIKNVKVLIEYLGGVDHMPNLPLMELRAHLMEEESTLARKYTGTVIAWGAGPHGQLGLGKYHNKTHEPYILAEHPTPIPTLLNKQVRHLAAGRDHVLALTKYGTVYSWGCGRDGRLGHGDYEDRVRASRAEPRACEVATSRAGFGISAART